MLDGAGVGYEGVDIVSSCFFGCSIEDFKLIVKQILDIGFENMDFGFFDWGTNQS